MAKTYAQIQREIAALSREAEKLREKEVAEVVAKIKEAIAVYGLTAADLGLAPGRGRGPVAKKNGGHGTGAKYRDAHGNTWSGRGPRPQWLKDALANGQALDDFTA